MWQELREEKAIQLKEGQESYKIGERPKRIHAGFIFDQGRRWDAIFPVSDEMWLEAKYGVYEQPDRLLIWVSGDRIHVYPTPGANPRKLILALNGTKWVETASGQVTSQISNDSDTLRLNDTMVVNEALWRFQQIRKMPFAEEKREAFEFTQRQQARNGGMARIVFHHHNFVGGGFDETTTPTPPAPEPSVPVAFGDSFTLDENSSLNVTAAGGVLANDTDAETAALVSDVRHGTLTFSANGSFVYTPDDDFVGTDSFTYKAVSGGGESPPATVVLTVNQVVVPPTVPDPPTAAGDGYSLDENTILAVAVGEGVLANDTDASSAVLVSDVSNGALVLNANGSFTYEPDADFIGTDSFTYKATNEGGDSATVTVTLTVRDVTPPVDDGIDAVEPDPNFDFGTGVATFEPDFPRFVFYLENGNGLFPHEER